MPLAAATAQPVPPSPPGGAESAPAAAGSGAATAAAIETLQGRVDGLTTRVIGVEAASSQLQRDARAALEIVVDEARREFEVTGGSILTLREEFRQEARTTRQSLGETRQGVELLYAGAQSELGLLRQQLADLTSQVTAGRNAQPQPCPGPAAPADPWTTGRCDPWRTGSSAWQQTPAAGTGAAGTAGSPQGATGAPSAPGAPQPQSWPGTGLTGGGWGGGDGGSGNGFNGKGWGTSDGGWAARGGGAGGGAGHPYGGWGGGGGGGGGAAVSPTGPTRAGSRTATPTGPTTAPGVITPS